MISYKENILKVKSTDFALRVIKLYKYLYNNKREYILSKQIVRSGTSVGAMVREAECSESKADFIHKMAIAHKEINETLYWLELLVKSDYISETEYNSINIDALEIIKLLKASLKTAKS